VEYFVIGDEDTVLGFSLVGVAGRVATDADEARDVFRGAIRNRSIGIIVITEPVADLIRGVVDEYVFTSDFPLILEIPDRHGRAEGRPGLREVVDQAIGIRV
jgi:V/A-type H+/Na+-transporting ATPase subunit F